VAKRIALAESALAKHESELLGLIASGHEVDPQNIKPRLVQVAPDTLESRLFRYACLHWSIPISDGYGRRLRFLIFDEGSGKLMGLFGLGDPVYAIKAGDEWIGWNQREGGPTLPRDGRLCFGGSPAIFALARRQAGGIGSHMRRSAQGVCYALWESRVGHFWQEAWTSSGFDHDDFRIGPLVTLQPGEDRRAGRFRER
jgi:hypothetical protein